MSEEILKQMAADLAELKAASTKNIKAGTIEKLIPHYLDERRARVHPRTIAGYHKYLSFLLKTCPGATVASIDVPALVRAATAVPTWGDTHRANVLATIGSFLRWAGRNEKMPVPPKASRGADAVVSEATYKRCVNETCGDFRQIIRFMWLTGCRPGEATGLTAESVSWDTSTIRLKQHKCRHKNKERILYLASEALEVLKDQAEKYDGKGLLFRGLMNKRFSLQSMTMRFQRLSEKVGTKVTSYAFRHTFCSRALTAGVPDAQVAAMMGHSSTEMVHRHYNHISADGRMLREIAERLAAR